MVFFLIVCYNCRRVTVPGTRGFFRPGKARIRGNILRRAGKPGL